MLVGDVCGPLGAGLLGAIAEGDLGAAGRVLEGVLVVMGVMGVGPGLKLLTGDPVAGAAGTPGHLHTAEMQHERN